MLGVVRVADLFGPSLDDALVDAASDPKGAACQAAVAAGLAGLARRQLGEFNACKEAGLEDGTIRSAADLQACFGADPKRRVARRTTAMERSVRRRCAGTAVSALRRLRAP